MYMLLLVCIVIIVFLIVAALFLYHKLTSERQLAREVDDVLHNKKVKDRRLSVKELDE